VDLNSKSIYSFVVESVVVLMNVRKLLITCVLLFVFIFPLTSCTSEENYSDNVTTISNSYNNNSSSNSSVKSNVSSSSSNFKSNSSSSYTYKKISHYCQADGCTKEGTKEYIGLSGNTEYYCYTHYKELMNMIGNIEEDVGKGNYSKHTCEECDKEGIYSIVGISGRTEYYCTKHYYEMKELLDSLY
jgi:hypothetical protein